MRGDNFTEEYKYPIKIYRIWKLEFANGLEVRKLIFSAVLAAIMIFTFMIFGINSDSNILAFLAKNWLIILVVIPGVISFVVFNLEYDGKGFISFFKDRIQFYLTKHKAYEHFIEVPKSQMERDLTYEPFKVEGGGNNE